MKPVALEKAEALHRFALKSGAPLAEFKLALTLGEGYELIDYFAAGGLGRYQNHDQVVQEVAEAKAAGDPWLVLQYLRPNGLEVVRLESVQ